MRKRASRWSFVSGKLIPLFANLRSRCAQLAHGDVRQLQCKDRFGPAIGIYTARCHPVAAASGYNIGQDHAAVVGTKEPRISRLGMLDPTLIRIERIGRSAGFDRGLSFERLLIERTLIVAMPKGFRPNRAEQAASRSLPLDDPVKREIGRASCRERVYSSV